MTLPKLKQRSHRFLVCSRLWGVTKAKHLYFCKFSKPGNLVTSTVTCSLPRGGYWGFVRRSCPTQLVACFTDLLIPLSFVLVSCCYTSDKTSYLLTSGYIMVTFQAWEVAMQTALCNQNPSSCRLNCNYEKNWLHFMIFKQSSLKD